MSFKTAGNAIGRLRRLPEIECLFPETVEKALALLEHYDGSARVIAGGTDLLNQMKRRIAAPKVLIDLKGISALDFIKRDGDGDPVLRIGALATLSRILESPVVHDLYPILTDTVAVMATPQVRNSATMVGNLCNAVPSADSAPPLIVVQAKLKVVGPEKERTIPVEDFFAGPRETVLVPGELVTEIIIPFPPAGGRGTYLKHMLRAEGDLATVGVAVYLTVDSEKAICRDARIALGAAAPTPMRAFQAEDTLKGRAIGDPLIDTAAGTASEEARPIDDIRASAEYRREMVRVLTKRAIKQLLNAA